MKRLLFCISLLIYIHTNLFGQANLLGGFNMTYGIPSIRTITPLSETAHFYEPVEGFRPDSIIDEIQYFDGLGRPVQIVQRARSPKQYHQTLEFGGHMFEAQGYKDLVIHQEYDAYGRQSTSWLPLVSSYGGAFIKQDIIKENANNLYNDSAYSRPVYEASPLNRIAEQYGPGNNWYTNSRSVKTEYLANSGTSGELSCIWFTVDGAGVSTSLTNKGYYNNAELYVTKITNEEASISYEFKDKLGQVLLTRQINNGGELLDTYYVYDDFGNLCFVVPPIAAAIAAKGSLSAENLDLYGFQYKYDDRKRCTQKKLPGAKPMRYIYDKADRLIFTQDGEQEIKGEWMFTLSDAFGRNVLTGICKNTDITNENYKDLLVEAQPADNATYKGYNIQNTNLVSAKILTVSYYDDYRFLGKYGIPNWASTDKDGYGKRFTGDNKGYETKGLLTGTSVALLDGSDTYLHSVTFYDNRARVVQTIESNHLAGEDKTWFAYSYTDWMTRQQHEHTAKGKTQTEIYVHTYDRAGRLTKTDYKLNELPSIVLAENKYNELGQLESSTPVGAANLKTAYTYNIRSWTDSIANSHFKEKLAYDFSGNIQAMNWHQNANRRTYTFEYDKISRLTAANYKGAVGEDFSTSYKYDAQGNIQFLTRNGLKDDNKPGLIDDLEFKYIGNQMKSVKDHAAIVRASASADIKNYVDQDIEFLYNANGAMKQDLNKGIQDITYNYLNLPKELWIDNDNVKAKNTYTYTATGSKLKVVHQSDPKQKGSPLSGLGEAGDVYSEKDSTDYVGNMIYEDGDLKRILLSNGYYDNDDKKFYFYIRDHLGNNRIVADAAGTVIQSNQYYPFGMEFAESTTAEQSSQPYKYNGKELDETHGLNWYDYGARNFDSGYITFPTQDLMSEKYYSWSPYHYAANNPIALVDVDGKQWGITSNGKSIAINVNVNFSNAGVSKSLINAYKSAISQTLNDVMTSSTGGLISGSVQFNGGESSNQVVPSLSLYGEASNNAGMAIYENVSINVQNSDGSLKSPEQVGIDGVHELFHTLRLGHPFSKDNPISDATLLKAPNGDHFTTPNTSWDILENVMNYEFTKINGVSADQSNVKLKKLTRDQIRYIINAIYQQQKGYGKFQKQNEGESDEEYNKRNNRYYHEYWDGLW